MERVRVEELLKRKKPDDRKNGFHMMATKAYHKMGNVSSGTADICFIYSEIDDEFYVGNWVFGFGYFDVLFPKATTRELTAGEISKYNGRPMATNNSPIGNLEIKFRHVS